MNQEMTLPGVKSNDIVNTLPEDKLLDIVRMVFTDQISDEEIAKQSGMSKPTLYKLKKTERFQSAIKDYGELAVREADTKIQANVDKAVTRLISLLDSEVPSVSLKASTEIIRLAGLGLSLPTFTSTQPQHSDQATVLQYLQVIALEQGKQNEPVSG